jgi:hypothetical protein
MMTLEQLLEKARASRRSHICAPCGQPKKTQYGFCPRCYKLPPAQKNPLLSSNLEDYLRGYVECYQTLMEEEEQAAQRILGNANRVAMASPLVPSLDQLTSRAKSVRVTKAELGRQSRQRHLEAHRNGWD